MSARTGCPALTDTHFMRTNALLRGPLFDRVFFAELHVAAAAHPDIATLFASLAAHITLQLRHRYSFRCIWTNLTNLPTNTVTVFVCQVGSAAWNASGQLSSLRVAPAVARCPRWSPGCPSGQF